MSLPVLVKVEDRNEEVCCSFHADCLKVRLYNQLSSKQRTGLIIGFLAVIIHLPDTPLWQEIQIKSPDVLCWGAWTVGQET